MTNDNHLNLQTQESMEIIANSIRELAANYRGDSLRLLAILRVLESLHQEIRDGWFQDSLPDNRQALYSLLKDIEAAGGWPYIHRLKLQLLLKNFAAASDTELLTSLLSGGSSQSNSQSNAQ